MSKAQTPTVDAMGKMNFQGHIIPHTWYDHITYKTPKGTEKVDLQAIVILSDIVYWYRPRIVLDEHTNREVRRECRFAADKLQRNYQQIADRFGMSKNQAARACKRLRDLGLITMEFRTVQTGKGPLPNVLFLEPVPERIAEINEPVRISSQICQDIPTKSPGHPDEIVKTNTENTPQNTPQITSKPVSEIPENRKPDILDAMVLYGTREEPVNWSVPAAAGGADDWQGAVTAFAELTGIDPGLLTSKERREWSRVLERVGASRKVGPAVVVEVIRKVPDSEDNWRTFSKPHELEAVLKKLIGQHLNGGIRGPKGNNGIKPISQQIAEYRAKVARRNQGAEILEGTWEVI